MNGPNPPIRVSLVAIPESMAFPVIGLYETLGLLGELGLNRGRPFQVEIVGRKRGILETATGLPITVQRTFSEVQHSDIVVATSMAAGEDNEWVTGRHPEAVTWLRHMHGQGAILCSSCTGVLLLAETGLLGGLDATIHWAYAPTFRANFPEVRLQLREVLLTRGERREFVMAGATSSWQDLLLYLVTRYAGPEAAQALGKFMLFQWHADTQAPYVTFAPAMEHDDAMVREVQRSLAGHASGADTLKALVTRAGVSETTVKRRFKKATGYSPVHYLQLLRMEEAKRRLEGTEVPVDEISWQVGYESPASFRRLFKRTTRLTPGEYRRKFRIPDFARAGGVAPG